MISYTACLDLLAKHRTDEVVIAAMSANVLWGSRSKSDRDIGYTDPMGTVHPLALGIALARPDVRVWALNGDGSLLMNLGALATIAEAAPPNLTHFLFNNGVYSLTGFDPIASSKTISFSKLAEGAGWRKVYDVNALDALEEIVQRIKTEPGPHFVTLHVDAAISVADPNYARLSVLPATAARYGRHGVERVQRSLAATPRPGR